MIVKGDEPKIDKILIECTQNILKSTLMISKNLPECPLVLFSNSDNYCWNLLAIVLVILSTL